MPELEQTKRKTYIRQALVLVWIGLLWNIVEAVVALWSGTEAGSVSLITFGLKSIVELLLGGVLIWHLNTEWKSGIAGAGEEKATKLLGGLFFVLAAYTVFQSAAALLGWIPRPEESAVGIFLILASAGLMTVLYIGKMKLAKKLGSRALKTEATGTLACDLQDLLILAGLGLNALFGWWWADPVAAFLLAVFLVKEGREAFEHPSEKC